MDARACGAHPRRAARPGVGPGGAQGARGSRRRRAQRGGAGAGPHETQATDEALVALLGRHEQAVSARIAAMCIEIGARTAPLLIATLRDGSPQARFWAARILGEIREGSAVATAPAARSRTRAGRAFRRRPERWA